ncbi:MAG: porin [Pseudomonadota bacterium]
MMNTHFKRPLIAAILMSPLSAIAATQPEINQLQQQVSELEQRIEALGDATDARPMGSSPTTIGGYGELHYNNLENQLVGGTDKKEIDFHRFVLFFGHEFNSHTRLFTELELEHTLSGDGQPGEVELEQAYVEFDLNDQMNARGGLFLIPIGLINETHEPPTFYGVERNPVEKNIIPATWWEAGVGFSHHMANGISYDLALHSGLYAADYNIRGSRQKVAKAKADALAYTARIKWTGIPGLELSATLNHQTDIRQDTMAKSVAADLLEAHAVFNTGPFAIRALYAQWTLDDDGTATGKDEQNGWYIEPSYKVDDKWGVFARLNTWDNQAGDSADSEYQQTDLGVNYWPHQDVVIKLDYQDQSTPTGTSEYDGINLGIGYQF